MLNSLLYRCQPIGPSTTGQQAYELFCEQSGLQAIAVVDSDSRPVGIIRRTEFFIGFGQRWGRALYEARPVTFVMDKQPLCIPVGTDPSLAARIVASQSGDTDLQGFIIVDDDGRYLGIGDGAGLLRSLIVQREHEAEKLTVFNRELERLLLLTAAPETTFRQASREACRMVAAALNVDRVGIWLHDDAGNMLVCSSSYCARTREFGLDSTLNLTDIPTYASSLKSQRVIDATHALQDQRTAELADDYLIPHDVQSILDAQIRAGERLAGALCCESVGEVRVWRPEEIAFAASVAGLLGQLLLALDLREERALLEQRVLDRTADLLLARQAAEAASVAKSQFLATMSHELRTPLNGIIGYSEIMRETAVDDDRQGDIADHDRVLSAARRLLRQINDILDHSRVESGCLSLEITEVDVARVARDALDAVRPQAAAKGNELCLEVEEGLKTIQTDGFRLGQCLLNLLSNAAKFTSHGRVQLRVRDSGGTVSFEVSDTGIGIDPDRIPDLFEPFVQADASITRAFGGTGLGLAITRQLAQLLGGDVLVDSVPGKGSRFTLTVAHRVAEEAGAASPEHAAQHEAGNEPELIMIHSDAGGCPLRAPVPRHADLAA